ncbi:hypothetical protein KVT40_004729 [Elsinoe batatas]|uniref:Regulator of phospholipase D SRF1 n=1 Tax=Elsinoe batatas TaxID=2601811 RepID=A0A8K0L3W9_9PEZI|nr:hypothetical protein KVT40_004729 [Elsinoe batatas]
MAQDWASSTVNNNHNTDSPDTKHNEEQDDDPRPQLRSIPPWIITPDQHDRRSQLVQPLLRPQTPVIPHHQYLPESQRGNRTGRGRRWDHLRDAEPAMLDQTLHESSARWLPFMLSGPQYKSTEVQGSQVMSDEWMEENMPIFASNYDTGEDEHKEEKHRSFLFDAARRRGSVNKAKGTILKNPFVPLVFRLITAIFTLAALGLGARVYKETSDLNSEVQEGCTQRASTYIAIIVDTIAVPYIIYVTLDEYTSKPLGLRSATAKTALLLIDLYFIVFYSSNLALAFDALTDTRWACYDSGRQQTCPRDPGICHSQTGLSAVLLVALITWCITFSISVLRVVKRLRPDE